LIFDYPDRRESRRHGPEGYSAYESYRPWLRDEFDFRCVYCLKRETWGQVTSEFALDHFAPQALNPALKLDYHNLIYACQRCNSVKRSQTVGDPTRLLCASLVTTLPDGSLRPHDPEVNQLIRQLDLNDPIVKSWRVTWMSIVVLAEHHKKDLYLQMAGFPKHLPDLRKLKPPRNSRKEGLDQSRFAQRECGELPGEY